MSAHLVNEGVSTTFNSQTDNFGAFVFSGLPDGGEFSKVPQGSAAAFSYVPGGWPQWNPAGCSFRKNASVTYEGGRWYPQVLVETVAFLREHGYVE